MPKSPETLKAIEDINSGDFDKMWDLWLKEIDYALKPKSPMLNRRGWNLTGENHPKIHGGSRTAEYLAWLDMHKRCYDPTYRQYKDYGGRGIVVCARWHDPAKFLLDMGPRPPGLTLERVNNDYGYEPLNCIWATRKHQANNRRDNRYITIDGVTKSLKLWCEQYGIGYTTVQNRIHVMGMDPHAALTTPVNKAYSRK